MSTHTATIRWQNTGPAFLKRHYSREHTIHFDGGVIVPGSPSPHIVPAPWSSAAAVDPEEAFVASVASCHMLWFLHVAIDAGFEPASSKAILPLARPATIPRARAAETGQKRIPII
jgi:organic hydroperoxide reductase OsmC/OhrA